MKRIYEVEVETRVLASPDSAKMIIKVETRDLETLNQDTKKKLCEYLGLQKTQFQSKILRYRLFGAVI